MRFAYAMITAVLSGCATLPSPCDFAAKSVPCEASIEVIDGQLILSSPACSSVRVIFDDNRPLIIENIDGHRRIGSSNDGASMIKGSCRSYPLRT